MSADTAPDAAEAPDAPDGPCGGTGTVISNLGGSPSQVPCPWCDGTGRFIAGHDAQAHWREGDGGEAAGPPAT